MSDNPYNNPEGREQGDFDRGNIDGDIEHPDSDTDIDPRMVAMPEIPVNIAIAAMQMVVALGLDGERYFVTLSDKIRLLAIQAGEKGEGSIELTWISGHPHKINLKLVHNPYKEKY